MCQSDCVLSRFTPGDTLPFVILLVVLHHWYVPQLLYKKWPHTLYCVDLNKYHYNIPYCQLVTEVSTKSTLH